MSLKYALTSVLAIALVLCSIPYASAADDAMIDCRMDAGSCDKTAGPLLVTLDITPRPLRVMSELMFSVLILERGQPVTDASLTVGLTMPGMIMGNNIIRLVHKGGGVYEGAGVIIRCPTGKKIWKASVVIERKGTKRNAAYIFEVAR